MKHNAKLMDHYNRKFIVKQFARNTAQKLVSKFTPEKFNLVPKYPAKATICIY